MITSIPFSLNSFPVIPLASQDGENLHSMARLHPLRRATSSVFSAPRRKYSVTSTPVTPFRKALSSQVVNTRPLLRFTGGRGTGSPPSSSGHTGTISASGFCAMNFFTKLLMYSFFPCHRQGSPRRHNETNILLLFSMSGNISKAEKTVKRNRRLVPRC